MCDDISEELNEALNSKSNFGTVTVEMYAASLSYKYDSGSLCSVDHAFRYNLCK